MLSRVFTSTALLNASSSPAHALNAIGLCAKVAIMFGVKPMVLLIMSRVGFEAAGTWSGVRAAVLGIVVSAIWGFVENHTSCSTSATGRRGFCAQLPGRSGPID